MKSIKDMRTSKVEATADVSIGSEPVNGPALAGVVAAAFGSFMLGLFTTLAEASANIKTWLTFSKPVGPLSGKTGIGVISWIVAWVVLGFAWRKKDVSLRAVVIVTMVLLAIGALMTFPTFFEQFAAE